jgi:integrase
MLSDMALRALERRREIEIAERASAGPLWYETGLIFPNAIGRPLEPGNLLRRSYWPLLQRAGLPRMRFHDLRHTAATIMLSRGVHPKVASEILGHATVAITLDLYSHVTESMQAEAAQLMDETLAGPIPSGA